MKSIILILILLGTLAVGWADRASVPQSSSSSPATPITAPTCTDTAGQHLNWVAGAFTCGTTTSATSYLSGTTASIGGSLLALGGVSSGIATVTGATSGTPCTASASDGTNIAALGVSVECAVTGSNTVTVSIVAFVTLTPPSKTYNVRVFP